MINKDFPVSARQERYENTRCPDKFSPVKSPFHIYERIRFLEARHALDMQFLQQLLLHNKYSISRRKILGDLSMEISLIIVGKNSSLKNGIPFISVLML